MQVLLDGRIVLPRMTGAGRYVIEIARRLPKLDRDLSIQLLLLPLLKQTEIPKALEQAGVSIKYCDVRVSSVRGWAVIPWLLRRLRPDLYHCPFLALPYVHVPSVMTIYDLNPILMPEYLGRRAVLRRFVARRLLGSALRRCRIAIAISDAVHAEVEEHFPEGRGKIRTIHLGVDPTHWSLTVAQSGGRELLNDGSPWAGRPYALYVGVDRPHKNLVRLVRAFVRFRASAQWPNRARPYLWLAGVGAGSRHLRGEIEALNCIDSVRLTAALTESSLQRAYNGARVVTYVSTSEGFGLPILEALAAGVPVVAGSASSLPEVAGDAATYVSPVDEIDIARGLDLTWRDEALRRSLAERGAQRVREFSWETTARETLQAYSDAICEPRTTDGPATAPSRIVNEGSTH